MDVLQLRTFLAVAERGSFSAAARDLRCVQSNVTARIRRLEEHLGQAVFARGRGGARLTEFGERLRGHAVDLLARFEAAERDLLDVAGASAPLRLGAMETAAAARLPAVLQALRRRCPAVVLSLQTGPTAELLSLLWDRRIDAAFVAAPVDAERFRSILAFREDLVRVAPAQSGETAASELPLLAFRAGCSYRAVAESWLRAEGRGDADILDMGTFDGILGCVAAGMGFAVMPERAAREHRTAKTLTLTPLPSPFRRVETRLAWRHDHRPSRAHGELCSLLEDS